MLIMLMKRSIDLKCVKRSCPENIVDYRLHSHYTPITDYTPDYTPITDYKLQITLPLNPADTIRYMIKYPLTLCCLSR
jgi:hypothetical protein